MTRMFFRRGENRSTRRKTSQSRVEQRNNKLNPSMTPSLRIEPGPHWREASALTAALVERGREWERERKAKRKPVLVKKKKGPGARFSKSPENVSGGPGRKFVTLWAAYSVKLVLLYVAKGIKIKIIAEFRTSRRIRFEDTKGIISPEKFSGVSRNGPLAPV